MTFNPAPPNYPSHATYLEGEVKDSWGKAAGKLTLGWVSAYLRRAVVEIDRVLISEYPANNGEGVGWKQVFKVVNWDVDVYQSDKKIEDEDSSWSSGDLRSAMRRWRDSTDLECEWRYYLLCVPRATRLEWGALFSSYSAEAVIQSHAMIPREDPPWGTVQGERLGTCPGVYFRLAVHVMGHAMGLKENTADNGFMNSTKNIADSAGRFPSNIQWSFNAEDARRLQHLPDPWVRPGMISSNQPYSSGLISPLDRIDLTDSLELTVKPLLSNVPIGAPVRVSVTLRNTTDAPITVPASLSLTSGHISGRVVGPSGSSRRFEPVSRCLEYEGFQHDEQQKLEPDDEIRDDLNLFRGSDGAFFEAPGLHRINIDVTWEADNIPFFARGRAAIMVQPAMTESHAEAALKTLSIPGLQLALARAGDDEEAGLEALHAALDDETLRPHYAAIEAKRIAKRFRDREADPSAALKLLTSDTVMSPSEVRRVAALVAGVAKQDLSAVAVLKKAATGDKTAEEVVNALL